ncbi:uncharacterized protein LOC106667146 [Cimex lectularius]|uniref:Uncharacterized protein n=1 Tax=Cimex lectularius TaxID=79782 RepID=A0A8I6RUD3_CIMLE|nr:uncharacterized protein LOC106667146 [Cimex lectularius]
MPYLGVDDGKWDMYLSEITFALNSSAHASTGYSPAFINFGRELRQPNTLRSDSKEMGHYSDPTTWQRSLCALQEIRLLVEKNLSTASKRQFRYYNLRRRPVKYDVGDWVMRRAHHLSSAGNKFAAKLASRFEGPFINTKMISNNVYELGTTDGKKASHCHVAQLKPYHSTEVLPLKATTPSAIPPTRSS